MAKVEIQINDAPLSGKDPKELGDYDKKEPGKDKSETPEYTFNVVENPKE